MSGWTEHWMVNYHYGYKLSNNIKLSLFCSICLCKTKNETVLISKTFILSLCQVACFILVTLNWVYIQISNGTVMGCRRNRAWHIWDDLLSYFPTEDEFKNHNSQFDVCLAQHCPPQPTQYGHLLTLEKVINHCSTCTFRYWLQIKRNNQITEKMSGLEIFMLRLLCRNKMLLLSVLNFIHNMNIKHF